MKQQRVPEIINQVGPYASNKRPTVAPWWLIKKKGVGQMTYKGENEIKTYGEEKYTKL